MSQYLSTTIAIFRQYKNLGEKFILPLDMKQLQWRNDERSNNIAILVKHMHGNMLSRWTNFLTEDGEKTWRQRDDEFVDTITDKATLWQLWEEGWACLFAALENLDDEHLGEGVFIRSQPLTVMEAIQRQLAHYIYHVGQIVVIAKQVNP